MTYSVLIGYAIARPPIPMHVRFSTITLDARTPLEARLLASQWRASDPSCVMVTQSEVIGDEEHGLHPSRSTHHAKEVPSPLASRETIVA